MYSILKKFLDVIMEAEYISNNGDELVENLRKEMIEDDEEGNEARQQKIEQILFFRKIVEAAEGANGMQSMLGENLEFDPALSLITRDDED